MASGVAFLQSLGFKPGEEGVFLTILACVEERGYTYKDVTNQFILALADCVETTKSGIATTTSMLSIAEFCLVVLYMVARIKKLSTAQEAAHIKKLFWNKLHFPLLERHILSGKVGGGEVWAKVMFIIVNKRVSIPASLPDPSRLPQQKKQEEQEVALPEGGQGPGEETGGAGGEGVSGQGTGVWSLVVEEGGEGQEVGGPMERFTASGWRFFLACFCSCYSPQCYTST